MVSIVLDAFGVKSYPKGGVLAQSLALSMVSAVLDALRSMNCVKQVSDLL